MFFISLLSIVCAISTTNGLPASLLPVRPYVFLAPELPKFQLQPTLKVQSPLTNQPVPSNAKYRKKKKIIKIEK